MDRRLKILYIDDEIINTQLFAINFEEAYTVIIGNSGQEGLDLLDENPDIQVTISDMRMPGMDGIEFITKAKEQYSDIKYFILTGFDISDRIQQAIDNKLIHKYFRKPFQMDVIKQSINKALEEG